MIIVSDLSIRGPKVLCVSPIDGSLELLIYFRDYRLDDVYRRESIEDLWTKLSSFSWLENEKYSCC